MGDVIDFPGLPSEDEQKKASRWTTVLEVQLPEGTTRHPQLSRLAAKATGRICAIDTGVEGVRLGYSTRGETEVDAWQDSWRVARQVLDFLGVQPQAIVQHVVVNRDNILPPEPPTLNLA